MIRTLVDKDVAALAAGTVISLSLVTGIVSAIGLLPPWVATYAAGVYTITFGLAIAAVSLPRSGDGKSPGSDTVMSDVTAFALLTSFQMVPVGFLVGRSADALKIAGVLFALAHISGLVMDSGYTPDTDADEAIKNAGESIADGSGAPQEVPDDPTEILDERE